MNMRNKRICKHAQLLRGLWKPKKVDAQAEIDAGRLDPRALILLKFLGNRACFVQGGSLIKGRKEIRLFSGVHRD